MSDLDDPTREQVRATILVLGKVIGVFFRASAQSEGMRLGLNGEVRNLPEGAVEAIVEGERQAVESFAAWCKLGPPMAAVDSVHVRYAAPKGEFRTFMIAR
jgi:acylphosphatase